MIATGRHRHTLSGWLVLAGSVLLVLPGCNRFSWGPDGMRIAVGSAAPSRPPFDVEEALVLRAEDRPPEAVDRSLLQWRFSAAIEDGLLPPSGGWALVAWLLIDRNGTVADVQVERSSGDPTFDEVFSEGISLSRFRPAERIAAESPRAEPPRAEPVSVWMEYPYSIDRPPIVVPPTVLVQPPPEAWGEGRRVSGVSGRPDRAGSLPEPGAGSPESYEDGWCCTRAATVR